MSCQLTSFQVLASHALHPLHFIPPIPPTIASAVHSRLPVCHAAAQAAPTPSFGACNCNMLSPLPCQSPLHPHTASAHSVKKLALLVSQASLTTTRTQQTACSRAVPVSQPPLLAAAVVAASLGCTFAALAAAAAVAHLAPPAAAAPQTAGRPPG